MAYLGYALGFIGTAAFLFGVSWVARVIRKHEAEDHLQPIDFGSLEGDLTHYVHNLNKVKR
jgi:hypothetical protein